MFELFWARKLLSRRRQTLGAVALLVLVLVPLVVGVVFVDSMIDGITDKLVCLSGGQIRFTSARGAVIDDPRLSPVVSGFAEAYSEKGTLSLMVKGVGEGYFGPERLAQISITAGDGPKALGGVMASASLARALGIEIGDRFALMVLSKPKAKGGVPVFRPVMVRLEAIYSSGYSQLDDNLLFGSLEYFDRIFGDPTIEVEMLTGVQEPQRNRAIAQEMIQGHPQLLSFRLWNEINAEAYENFASSRQMVTAIILVIALVACFYCGTSAHEASEDNWEEICAMRLLGASDLAVRRTLFLAVVIRTATGVLAGFALGLLLSFHLAPLLRLAAKSGFEGFAYYLLDFPIRADVPKLLVMAALFMLASALSVLLALRKERESSPLMLLRS